MDKAQHQNNDDDHQILELRQHIYAQSRWTLYLNHIIEKIMNVLIDAGKKVNLKYELKKVDNTKAFNNICDNFQQFVDFALNLYTQVQERGGLEEIDENIKKSQEILVQMESSNFTKAQKANDIIQNLIGKDYNPDDLERIFATSQNNSLIATDNSLADKYSTNILSDDQQHKSEVDTESVNFANKIREEFSNFQNDEEILDQLTKLKKDLIETNEKLNDTNKVLESKTKSLNKTHKQLESIAKELNIELPSSENPENNELEFSEEQFSKILERAKKDKKLRDYLQSTSNNENEEIDVEQMIKRQENNDQICQQLSETKKQLQSKLEELEKTQSQFNEILQVLNLNDENTEGPMNDDLYSSILEKAKKVKEMNDLARSSFPDCSEIPDEIKLAANGLKTRSIKSAECKDNLLNDLNKTQGQPHEFEDIFSTDKEKDENKQINSDENKQVNSDENKQINSDENKQTNSDENKQTNSDESKQINSDENKQINSDENKQINSDENKQTNSDENKQINSDESKQVNSDENKQINSDESRQTNSDVSKQINSDENKQINSDENKQINSDENKQVNSDENKQINSDESKQTNSDESKQVNSDENKQVNSDENKQTNSDESKQVNSDESNQTNSDENKQVNSDENKQINSDESKQVNSDESKLANSDESKQVNSDENKQTNSDESNQTNSDESNQTNSDENKQVNSDENKQINSDESNQKNSNESNQTNSDESKQTNSNEQNKQHEPINDEEFESLIEAATKDRDISSSIQQSLHKNSSNDEEATKEIKNLQLHTFNLQNQLRNLISAIEGIEEPDDQELTDSRIEEDISKIKNENKIMDLIENLLLNPTKETIQETEKQEINKSFSSEIEPEKVADKINYLNNRSVELDNVNQTVSSLTQELEQAKQKLENKTNELVETQKQLAAVYEVIEVLQGEAVNPEDLTPEKLEEIINKAREDKELVDSIELMTKSPHKKDSSSTNSHRSISQDYFRLIHQLEEFASIYCPTDENGNKKSVQELNDEEFAKMIEAAKKNKQMSDAVQSSLSQSTSSSPDEVEKKIKSLESRSIELDRITDQFSQVLNAIGTTEEISETTEINNNQRQQEEDTEKKNEETNLTFNARDISNEQLSCFISKAKKSNEITSAVNKNLPDHSSTGKEVENTLIDLKSRSEELDKITLAFDRVLNAVRGNEDKELTTENQEEIHIPNSRNISDEELLQAIAVARRANEITKVVETTIPDHSSTARDVENAINTFKSRSEELDEVSQKLNIKSSDLEKLRSHFNTLFTIHNLKQNENDELIGNGILIDTKNNDENISISSVKSRKVNDDIIEEEEEECDENLSSTESTTTTTESSNNSLKNSFNETNKDSNVDESNKDQDNEASKLNELKSKHFNNTNHQEMNNQLDNLNENAKDQDIEASIFNEFKNNHFNNTNHQEMNNQLNNQDENDKNQGIEASKLNELKSKHLNSTNHQEMNNQLDNQDENSKDKDNEASKLNELKSKHLNRTNHQEIDNQLDNLDENDSQLYKSDIRSETSNMDDKIVDLIEKVKRSKNITTVVETSFPEDSENAEQVENKIKKLENRSVQLDNVSQELDEQSSQLKLVRKQLKEVMQALSTDDSEQKNIEDMTEEEFTNLIEQKKKESEAVKLLNKRYNNKGVDIIKIQKTLNDFDRSVAQLQEFLKIFDNDESCNVDEIDDDIFSKIIEKAKKDNDISLAVKLTLPSHSSCSDEVKTTVKILKLRSNELDKVRKQLQELTAELQKVRMQLNSMIFSSFPSFPSTPSYSTNDNDSYNDPFDSHDYLSNNDFAFF